MKIVKIISIVLLITSCNNNETITDDINFQDDASAGCPGVFYPDWQTSSHVLPYPVGQSYTIGLSHCSGFPHIEGEPDQFAIDFIMDVGTLVTASRLGTIMFVEESGLDFESVNNMVVLRDEDGYFLQYQHLTHNGALVEEGDIVQIGDPIGYSGASGLASYPHLHFVATRFGDWMFPYTQSYPITFSNTTENSRSLLQGETYEAFPY
ncbi:MAG: M23 family metallopeptidase [Bacteroidia bacterium]|nr:M23 family metallopeptidase [Bacteroidia bacterium]NND52926.1 M23 family metallopeptidase [Flavobacteriaceae bacterium]NNL79432.1 M23 family metallopeptidase [Flavobacteriaceae bacterium]